MTGIFRQVAVSGANLRPVPFKNERVMQAYIIENESILTLSSESGVFSDVQIVIDELSHGDRTRSDLLVTYATDSIGVVELKNVRLTQRDITQLERYMTANKRSGILTDFGDGLGMAADNPEWIGVLVGTSIDLNLAERINNGLMIGEDKDVRVAALTMNRFRGDDGQVYVVTDTYFKKQTRDGSKYIFNGNKYGKGRLVLAVVRNYVESHPNISYQELQRAFPDRLQGATGVFTTLEQVEGIYERSGHARHFLKPEEQIMLGDRTIIAVCNQWGAGPRDNIGGLIDYSRNELNYDIVVAQ